jgi:hypothetical protein
LFSMKSPPVLDLSFYYKHIMRKNQFLYCIMAYSDLSCRFFPETTKSLTSQTPFSKYRGYKGAKLKRACFVRLFIISMPRCSFLKHGRQFMGYRSGF